MGFLLGSIVEGGRSARCFAPGKPPPRADEDRRYQENVSRCVSGETEGW